MYLPNINLESFIEWLLTHGIKVVLILVGAWVLSRVLKPFIFKFLKKFIKKSLSLTRPQAEVDEERFKTISSVVISVARVLIWVVVILTIMPEFGINIAPLLAGLGVAGLALGLGARSLIQDYLSGLFILLEDHYQVSEEVEVAGVKGKVEDFNLRRTVVRGEDNTLHYLPNSQIKKASNFSRKS